MAQKKLNEGLDIIQNSNLEISLLEGDLNIIQKLDDEPNDVGGLTAQELKARFDRAGNIIKEYINETLVPEVLSEGITENRRRENEAARQTAEAKRQAAESGRASAETARGSAEAARASAEAARRAAETMRETAESGRASAEAARGGAEAARATAEDLRQAAETIRETAEAGRVSAEAKRETAEAARAGAEAERETAEAGRKTAQTAFFTGVTAVARALAPGSAATAAAVAADGSFRLELGIPQGERGDDGAGLEVLGLYETPEALRAARPTGRPGEAFAVGAAEDNALYIWCEGAGDWVSVGPLRGETGKSAYEVAVQNGYVGSAADWLASLKGPKGDSGGSIVPAPNLEDKPRFLTVSPGKTGPEWSAFTPVQNLPLAYFPCSTAGNAVPDQYWLTYPMPYGGAPGQILTLALGDDGTQTARWRDPPAIAINGGEQRIGQWFGYPLYQLALQLDGPRGSEGTVELYSTLPDSLVPVSVTAVGIRSDAARVFHMLPFSKDETYFNLVIADTRVLAEYRGAEFFDMKILMTIQYVRDNS